MSGPDGDPADLPAAAAWLHHIATDPYVCNVSAGDAARIRTVLAELERLRAQIRDRNAEVQCSCEDADRTYAELVEHCDAVAAERDRLRAQRDDVLQVADEMCDVITAAYHRKYSTVETIADCVAGRLRDALGATDPTPSDVKSTPPGLNSAEGISSRPTEQEGGPPNDALTGDEIRSCHGRDCGKDDCTTCTSMRTYYDRLDELCGCTCHNEDDADA